MTPEELKEQLENSIWNSLSKPKRTEEEEQRVIDAWSKHLGVDISEYLIEIVYPVEITTSDEYPQS